MGRVKGRGVAWAYWRWRWNQCRCAAPRCRRIGPRAGWTYEYDTGRYFCVEHSDTEAT